MAMIYRYVCEAKKSESIVGTEKQLTSNTHTNVWVFFVFQHQTCVQQNLFRLTRQTFRKCTSFYGSVENSDLRRRYRAFPEIGRKPKVSDGFFSPPAAEISIPSNVQPRIAVWLTIQCYTYIQPVTYVRTRMCIYKNIKSYYPRTGRPPRDHSTLMGLGHYFKNALRFGDSPNTHTHTHKSVVRDKDFLTVMPMTTVSISDRLLWNSDVSVARADNNNYRLQFYNKIFVNYSQVFYTYLVLPFSPGSYKLIDFVLYACALQKAHVQMSNKMYP